MSRSAGDPRPWVVGPVALVFLLSALLLLPLTAPPAAAQTDADGSGSLVTAQRVRYSLGQLQKGWLEWSAALHGGDEERARRVVDDLAETLRRLGMRGAPDLAAGALVEAVDAARGRETERAALALEAAERLAPGRPETAFAAAEVARLSGDWPAMLVEEARGYARLSRTDTERRLVVCDLILWGLASLLLAAAVFVILQLAVRGPAMARNLGRAIGGRFRRLPGPVVTVMVAVLLLWPLALPGGLFWLLLYWSLLLWGSLNTGGRWVLVGSWALLAVTPLVVNEVGERVALGLSPAVRAMESVERGELYGGLFTDLGVLPAILEDEPAVDHFLGDLHVRLGQWDDARRHYEAVLTVEEDNVAALVNLGVYYIQRGDLGNASHYLTRATEVEEGNREHRAAAWFDLAQTYADSNLFDEQAAAFERARSIDDDRVTQWQRSQRPVVTVNGGLARSGDLERALRRHRRASDGASPALAILRQARPALLLLILAVAALATHAVTRHRRGAAARSGDDEAAAPRWLAALVPGLASVHQGRAPRAVVEILLLAAPALALLIAFTGPAGPVYELPWRHDPGGWMLPAVAILVLTTVLATRAVRAARGGG